VKHIIAHIKHIYLPISETFIYQYIKNIQRFKIIILTRTLENLELFPFQQIYSSPKLQRYPLKWTYAKVMQILFKREIYYEKIIKKKRVALIHAHFGPQGVQILGSKNRLGFPLITTFYGYDMSKLAMRKKWKSAYKYLFDEGDMFLVEGNHMKEKLINLGCKTEKIKIQHIGVDVDKFKYSERKLEDINKKFKILFCGRFIEKKGLIYALKAVKKVLYNFPNIELRIIGDGDFKSEIVEFIHKENIEDKVVLLGYQPHDVFLKEVQNAHLLLQPSITASDGDSEGGAPVVLLEAQAAGLPVISTYHADIPEVVINGKSGFLVPERNSDAIAEKLEYLIDNPSLLVELGKYGRKHIEQNYNIFKEVKKLEDVYSQFI